MLTTSLVLRWISGLFDSVSVSAESWSEDDIEESLDSRDSPPFDSEWVEIDREIETRKSDLEISTREEAEKSFDELRKRAYSMVIRKSGSSDLAAYVSDDFELICWDLLMKKDSSFVFSLINSYLSGNIPDNSMERSSTNPSGLW